MKYFVYKRTGNYGLYWNYDRATWVERKDASIYTEKQRRAIDKVEGSDGGNWAEVVAEPVRYGEAPKPVPVIIGDNRPVDVEGYYWINDGTHPPFVANMIKGNSFLKGKIYVYIKEPAWPQ